MLKTLCIQKEPDTFICSLNNLGVSTWARYTPTSTRGYNDASSCVLYNFRNSFLFMFFPFEKKSYGQTDWRTDRQTDGCTDAASYRNARTHLKRGVLRSKPMLLTLFSETLICIMTSAIGYCRRSPPNTSDERNLFNPIRYLYETSLRSSAHV